MRSSEQELQRLLNAAAKAPREAAITAPLDLETRVLTQWKATPTKDELVLLFAFFRRAMFGSVIVMLFIAAWSLTRPGGDDSADQAAIGNYETEMGLNP